jgi:hypothetical protein
MIFLFLKLDKKSSEQKEIINFFKNKIKSNNIEYKILFMKELIIPDFIVEEIDKQNDIIFWEPKLAHYNIELMKTFSNSIVILKKPTIYLQKISEFNYINENMAINNGFFIMYINPEMIDITNSEWKLAIRDDIFLLTIEKFLNNYIK